MQTKTADLLQAAQAGNYALGAFNVYNLEGVRAVISAAEAVQSPAILQLHPAPLRFGGLPLVSMCLTAARASTVPVAVHLDHGTDAVDIHAALAAGLPSVMADGSARPYEQNVAFTRALAEAAHAAGASIEAELGRLSGTEDGLAITEREAHMTDPLEAKNFVEATGVDALAICIGNVHGVYRVEPRLELDRLAAIRKQLSIPLVLHGASGLPARMVRQCIKLGVVKFNVNTELRQAYTGALRQQLASAGSPDLLDLMREGSEAIKAVVVEKLRLFESCGKVERLLESALSRDPPG